MKKSKKQAVSTSTIFKSPVAFADGLPAKRFEKTSKYIDVLSLLKNKNRWYQIAEFDRSSQANSIAQFLRRDPASLPDGKWDFAVRSMDNNKVGLFAQSLEVKKRGHK